MSQRANENSLVNATLFIDTKSNADALRTNSAEETFALHSDTV